MQGSTRKPKYKERLTHEIVVAKLHYDKRTGVFTWRHGGGGHYAGARAGCKQPEGYRTINICNVFVHEHRLAVFYVTGQWPNGVVDHRNDARDDNRWRNLRVVSHSANIQRSNKTWGSLKRRGVVRIGNRFAARIRVLGKTKHIGMYGTPAAAAKAYRKVRAAILNVTTNGG